MNRLKQLGLGAVVVAAVLGYKFYNKGQAKDETRQHLETACAQDAECLSGVGQHFESCFDENYKLGGRRRAGGLNTDGLVTCINGKVGKPLFSASQE